jgi:ABC-type Mn2+/Zn2+ transport system permease subunit
MISFAPLIATAAMAVACAGGLSVFRSSPAAPPLPGRSSAKASATAGLAARGRSWLIMLASRPLAAAEWMPYVAVLFFCLGTALAIGYMSRGNRVAGDAADRDFPRGFAGLRISGAAHLLHVRGVDPSAFEQLLFGLTNVIDPRRAMATVFVSVAVLVTLAALGKEILSYCFDPQMAQASGVAHRLIHYLLMV